MPWVKRDLCQEQDETPVTLRSHQLRTVAGRTLEIPKDKAQQADPLQELSVEGKGNKTQKIPEDTPRSPLKK